MFIFIATACVAISIIVTVGHKYFATYNNMNIVFLAIAVPFLVLVSFGSNLFPILINIIGKYKMFIIINNINIYGKIIFIVVFAYSFGKNTTIIIFSLISWGVVNLILSIILLCNSQKLKVVRVKFLLKFSTIIKVFHFSWPLSIAAGLYWLQSEGYRFVLLKVTSIDIVGKFVVAFSLGSIFMIAAETIFNQIYLPRFYKHIARETAQSHNIAWNTYFKKAIGVFIPLGLVLSAMSPFIARWLLHDNYQDIGYFLAFGSLAQLMRIISGVFYFGFLAKKNTGKLVIPGVIGSLFSLSITWMWAGTSPFIVTGLALVMSNAITIILYHNELSKVISILLPWKRIMESIALCIPICSVLILAKINGWDSVPVLNILIVLLSIFSLYLIQRRISYDIWFSKPTKVM